MLATMLYAATLEPTKTLVMMIEVCCFLQFMLRSLGRLCSVGCRCTIGHLPSMGRSISIELNHLGCTVVLFRCIATENGGRALRPLSCFGSACVGYVAVLLLRTRHTTNAPDITTAAYRD